MANTITLKKSGVAARVPTTASLSLGEIALNYKDGYLFYRDDEASPAVHKLNADDADTVDGFHLDQGVLTTSSPSFAGLTVDTDTLSVDSTNNRVGIGTTSPDYNLDIGGDTASASNTIRMVQAANGTAIRIGAGGGGNDVTLLRVDGAADPNNRGESDSSNYGFSMKYFGSGSGNDNRFGFLADNQASSTQVEAISILQDGNVGIGTTSPSSKLHISDNHSQLRLEDVDDSKFLLHSYSGGKYVVRNNSTSTTVNQFTLTEDGKFGIGTTSPSQKLDVAGSAIISGNVGIGTTSPSSKLHISDNHSQLRLEDVDDSKFLLHSYSGGKYVVRNNSTSTTVNQFTLTEDGKFGIGTISPSAPLHISSTSDEKVRFTSTTSGTPANFISFYDTGGRTSGFGMVSGGNDHFTIWNDTSGGDIRFSTSGAGNNRLIITSSGNVGIGTTSPTELLHLSSTGPARLLIEADTDNATETDNAQIILKQDGGGVVGRIGYATNTNSLEFTNEYSADLSLGTGGTKRLVVKNNGNVGIGTTSPTVKLEVAGNIAADNFFPPTQITSHSIGTYTANTINSATATNEGGGVDLAAGASSTGQAAVRTDRYFAAGRGSGQSTRLDVWHTVVGASFMRTFVDDTEAFINIGTGTGTPVAPTETTKGVFVVLKKASGAYTLELHHNRGTAATNTSTSASVSVNLSYYFQIEIRTTPGGTIEVFTSNDATPPTLLLSLTGLTFGQNGGSNDNNVWIGYRSTGYASYYGIGASRAYSGYYRT